MQPGLDRQERLYYKNKVSNFISSYERQQQEEQRQKANLKKNIMQSILNTRKQQAEGQHEKSVKTEAERTVKTNQSEEHLEATFKQPTTRPLPEPRFDSQEVRKPQDLQEVTFNAKKRNNSLQEELTFKESYLNQLRDRRLREELYRDQDEDEDRDPNKNESNHPPVQRSVYKSFHSSEEEGRLPSEEEDKTSKNSILQKYSQLKESLSQLKRSHQHQQPEYPDRFEEEDNRYEYDDEEQADEEPYDDREEDREEEWREKEEERKKEEERQPKGVFLTMEESESMVAEDPPKNYAFEIKLDKSMNPSDLEQLKQQRIREIERKRQERIEEFRRNESQKKVEMPRGKNSYSKKIDKDTLNESDAPPRSATIERKTNAPLPRNESAKVDREPTKAVEREYPKPLERDYPRTIQADSHESQYSIRPLSSKQLPPPPSPYHPEPEPRPPLYRQPRNQQAEKPLSPFRTPKSMASDNNRGKSTGKQGTIFTQVQVGRQKSSNKYEVKIEPKDRKNSFTRQSNKKQMVNAITYVVFPGELNRKERERLIDIIEASQYEFFVFLFKEYSRKMIKGIYVFDSSQTLLRRIHGDKSPPEITADMVQEFYKYDNGSREFKRLDGCRSFSFSISAIDLRK